MRWRLRQGLVAWAALSLVGALIVMLPDDGRRVFSLSEGHGPSIQDSIGIALLLFGWVVFLIRLIRSRASIWRPPILLVAAIASGALLVWSVASDAGNWWMLGALALVALQVLAALSAIRTES